MKNNWQLWFLGSAGALFVCHVIYAFLTHRAFYADGVDYFYQIISHNQVLYDILLNRAHADYITQWPVLFARNIFGVSDLQMLAYIWAAPYYLLLPLSLWWCWRICKDIDPKYLFFPAFSFFCFSMTSHMYILSEAHVLDTLSWPLIFLLVLKKQWTRWDIAIITAIALVLWKSYEAIMFFAPVFILASVYRVVFLKGSHPRLTTLLALWWVFVAGHNFYTFMGFGDYAVWHDYRVATSKSYLSTLANILNPSLFFGLFTALLAGVPLLLRRRCSCFENPKFLKAGAIIAAITFVAVSAFATTLPEESFKNRVLLSLAPPFMAFLMLLFVWKKDQWFGWSTKQTSYFIIILGLAIAGQSIQQLKLTHNWTSFMALQKQALAQGNGLQQLPKAPAPAQNFIWAWNNPQMSIVLQWNQNIDTIVDNRIKSEKVKLNTNHPDDTEIRSPKNPHNFKLTQPEHFKFWEKLRHNPYFNFTPFYNAVQNKEISHGRN